MRITTAMMTNRYMKNLNKSAAEMNHLNEKVYTGRKFSKGSEDSVAAIKSYKLRREYRTTEMYDKNISDVDSILTSAETNLTKISKDLETVYISYLKGINDTMSQDDREIIAKELEGLQKSIVTSLNAKFEDRYVFGGTSKEEVPFKIDDDGNLLYKNVNVNDFSTLDKLKDLSNETLNIDLGLGISFDGQNINKDTTFDMSLSGIKFMGFGTSDNTDKGIPNNLYTLIGNIKDQLKDDNYSINIIKPYIEHYEKQKNNVVVSITDIGSKTNYLEFLKLRNEDNQFNLNEKILGVEYVNPAEAIVDFKMQQYSYNAALSMGNKILQNSFIDFMK